jgi:hypothetical protein
MHLLILRGLLQFVMTENETVVRRTLKESMEVWEVMVDQRRSSEVEEGLTCRNRGCYGQF